MPSLYDLVPARYKLRRSIDELSLRTTRVRPVTPERLDEVFPEVRRRPEVIVSTPAEAIADAVDASKLRDDVGLADTQEMPAMPDPVATAEAMLRRSRAFGGSPTEALRRMFDEECRRAAARLTGEERARVDAFDATVGIGFGRAVRS